MVGIFFSLFLIILGGLFWYCYAIYKTLRYRSFKDRQMRDLQNKFNNAVYGFLKGFIEILEDTMKELKR